ncbi:hypothetical protein HRbin01_01053 [archaeon HR01]|nr:hypothetical protein HRbin01_01053 [archaeon HR01]
MLRVKRQDIEDLAVGAAILGTGGGGDPYIGKLMAHQVIERKGPIELLDPAEIDDEALVIPSAAMGTPTVLIEKVPSGDEAIKAFELLQKYLNKKATCTCPIEAGGVNSTIPFVVAGAMNIPVVDADGMGRAFPELQMVSFTIYGVKASPMAMADEKGNGVLFETIDNLWTEKIARVTTIKMGGTAWIALYACNGNKFKESSICRTVSKGIEIGRSLREAKARGVNQLDALLDSTSGHLIFRGKIVGVERANIGGFARGEATIQGLDDYKGQTMTIRFQNENLVAEVDGRIIASVPDLICIIDSETIKPITTERLRYGYRVLVVACPCSEKWRSSEGLKLVGPKYFGYDIEYQPIEKIARGG